jgi:riboflavin biosynthesis pyrimidine reductase
MSHVDDSEATVADLRDLTALYPETGQLSLTGLYLSQDLRKLTRNGGTFVYTNFITSLDGRIALPRTDSGQLGVPQHTANPRDWRLLLELAAPADALIVSGRYVRELARETAQALPPFGEGAPADLREYRAARGLAAQPVLVVVSGSLDLPARALARLSGRHLIVATVDEAEADAPTQHALHSLEIPVLRLGNARVEGARLLAALQQRGIALAYSIAGPEVLHTLLQARVLDRIYLTTVLRALAGHGYATLAHGPRLDPPYDFKLAALYLDRHGPDGIQQLLQVYDSVGLADREGQSFSASQRDNATAI